MEEEISNDCSFIPISVGVIGAPYVGKMLSALII